MHREKRPAIYDQSMKEAMNSQKIIGLMYQMFALFLENLWYIHWFDLDNLGQSGSEIDSNTVRTFLCNDMSKSTPSAPDVIGSPFHLSPESLDDLTRLEASQVFNHIFVFILVEREHI